MARDTGGGGGQAGLGPPTSPGHQEQYLYNKRQRLGLMPTDGQADLYKRPAARSSKRSRAERTSYLVATGHLSQAETELLNKQPSDDLAPPDYFNNTNYSSNQHFADGGPLLASVPANKTAKSLLAPSSGKSNRNNNAAQIYSGNNAGLANEMTHLNPDYEQTLLEDYHNLSFTPSQQQQQVSFQHHEGSSDSMFQANNNLGKSSSVNLGIKVTKHNQIKSPLTRNEFFANSKFNDSNKANSKYNRAKFSQTTYTEVTLPMKTSPAFEYILKDNKRRNKRCCLWLLYALLMTICISIIVFCIIQLVVRVHN